MSTSREAVIREILEEGLTDWVPVDRVIGAARDLSFVEDSNLQTIAAELIASLIENGLMVPGDIGPMGFEHWLGSPNGLVQRVIAICKSFNWQPQGAGCWLANTDKGDRLVSRN